MCKVLKVSKSGYYAWRNHRVSARASETQWLSGQIRDIFFRTKKTYGSPRVTKELRSKGIHVSRPRVARIMRKESLRSKASRRFVLTTHSTHAFRISPNLLQRRFEPGTIRRAWVSDITYIPTAEGWLYLTTILDLGDRNVIGWALSSSLKAQETVSPAWKMALKHRGVKKGLIFHSDQGIQYACDEFRALLSQHPGIIQSMSRKGNCWDNAVAESFFKSLKTELLVGATFRTRKEAGLAVFSYIEIWYNRVRLHSALGYKSPEQYLKDLISGENAA